MKKTLTTFLALATLVALAVPAGAGKPDKPDKPKPPGLLEVTISANLWSVNIPGDEIVYSYTVMNKGSQPLAGVASDSFGWSAEFNLAGGATADFGDDPEPVHAVTPEELGAEEIVNTLTATAGTVVATATVATTVVDLSAYCDWEALADPDVDKSEYLPCRWDAEPGLHTLTITPVTSGKPVQAQVTVRDHVPGNWCAESDGSGGALSGKLRKPMDLGVFFPEDGICLAGGAGGETMGVGTPGAYFLVVMGDITVTLTG